MLWPDAPTFTVKDAVAACNAGCTDQQDVEDLAGRLTDLVNVEASYIGAAKSNVLLALLHRFKGQQADPDEDLLLRAYKSGLVGRVDGRMIYDAIKASAVQGRCPLCGLGEIGTLDHHAPKNLFPLLAITPSNLVPACGICNQRKSGSLPEPDGVEDFHPYFDVLEPGRWLYAEVTDGVAEFTANPPAHWTARAQQRIRHHFDRYDLATRYKTYAVGLIEDRKATDRRLRELDHEVLREELREVARSHQANDPNSWSTALLHALAASDWYITSGQTG
ncbi:HNH endonuclease [Streptomyces sp. NPDC088762]|uniref:HNH endonuclease n=1 Tax=Streptomyces sp. NPDC088762 TaxID=3365891 RepID=UPI0037FC5865